MVAKSRIRGVRRRRGRGRERRGGLREEETQDIEINGRGRMEKCKDVRVVVLRPPPFRMSYR